MNDKKKINKISLYFTDYFLNVFAYICEPHLIFSQSDLAAGSGGLQEEGEQRQTRRHDDDGEIPA